MSTAHCRYCHKPVRQGGTRCTFCGRNSPIATRMVKVKPPPANPPQATPQRKEPVGSNTVASMNGPPQVVNRVIPKLRPAPIRRNPQTQCPHCAGAVELPAGSGGGWFNCPHCQYRFRVMSRFETKVNDGVNALKIIVAVFFLLALVVSCLSGSPPPKLKQPYFYNRSDPRAAPMR